MEQRKQLKVFLDAATTCDGIEGNFLEKEKIIGESIKAVGECGLDSTYYDKGSPRASQVCCPLLDSISTFCTDINNCLCQFPSSLSQRCLSSVPSSNSSFQGIIDYFLRTASFLT